MNNTTRFIALILVAVMVLALLAGMVLPYML
jgi:hypothetical protein